MAWKRASIVAWVVSYICFVGACPFPSTVRVNAVALDVHHIQSHVLSPTCLGLDRDWLVLDIPKLWCWAWTFLVMRRVHQDNPGHVRLIKSRIMLILLLLREPGGGTVLLSGLTDKTYGSPHSCCDPLPSSVRLTCTLHKSTSSMTYVHTSLHWLCRLCPVGSATMQTLHRSVHPE